jgi:predicted transposase/invertase (TIGR01784 family)
LEEAEEVVSNMARTWRKMYDDALLAGKAKGKIEGKLETARNMLKEGMSIAMVLKVTKLPEAEVINLQQELKTSGH